MAASAKILVACANGAGTSLMMKMTVERVAQKLGMNVSDIHHCALSEGVSSARQYDIVFAPLNFLNMYDDAVKAGVNVIGLRNVLSDAEVEEKLKATGAAEKFSN
ncbi:MAG: PTS sugar transporter subunit IIB [Atopobiaceae bacterium]|jgi:PTS system ascorbate-specific IIB component|nr:PTS sugar transporter subunit IIB [Atopobiaceae bacterium]MCH4181322.1 PTS sugar transporter subunit IIB [Atopobiaceae bacterium]MCH4215063.1 PTS sugar transporter subunit IIB [Atopobiaceae bacterium]MCH4230615.1 PTS sugar transporter subunit IIB [Atopobiaceae bacterium]MCH4276786.1 PTS sugar transporter subunit IIB [Atopobiaceae bacterium]